MDRSITAGAPPHALTDVNLIRHGIPGEITPERGGRFHAGEAHPLELGGPSLRPDERRRGIVISKVIEHLADVVKPVFRIAEHDDDPQLPDVLLIVQAVPAAGFAAWMQQAFLFPETHR